MKKIFNLLMIVGLVALTACDPMEDIYNEIDGNENAVVGDAEYTLTEDDYNALEIGYGSFDSEDAAKTAIPTLLAEMYPVWGKNSAVLVDYNLYIGAAEGVDTFTDSEVYYLDLLDYPKGDEKAKGFFPEDDAEALIVDLLIAKYDAPTEGDVTLVKYKQFIEEPVFAIATIFDAGFNGNLNGFSTVSVVGAGQVWDVANYGGDEYAIMKGYDNGKQVNEDWLISPEIDLSNESEVVIQVSQALNYADDTSLLSVLVSKDYDGTSSPSEATWDVLNFTDVPTGDSWGFVLSENLDFSAYEGEKIHVAFKYVSTDSDASTWEIDNLAIKTPGVTGETVNKELFYTYTDGEWETSEGVYYLSSADYDSMGEGSGQPGKYNNFDSSMKPDNYIPTFLKMKYAFAQEGDALIVVYKYYSSGVQTRGNLYTVIEGEWVGHKSVVSTLLQFGHDGTSWVPDNTIKHKLTDADYIYLSEYLATVDGYENLYASMGKYKNFDYKWSQDQVVEALGILAKNINPSAEEGQKYIFSYMMYDNGINELQKYLILEGGIWILNI